MKGRFLSGRRVSGGVVDVGFFECRKYFYRIGKVRGKERRKIFSAFVFCALFVSFFFGGTTGREARPSVLWTSEMGCLSGDQLHWPQSGWHQFAAPQ